MPSLVEGIKSSTVKYSERALSDESYLFKSLNTKNKEKKGEEKKEKRTNLKWYKIETARKTVSVLTGFILLHSNNVAHTGIPNGLWYK